MACLLTVHLYKRSLLEEEVVAPAQEEINFPSIFLSKIPEDLTFHSPLISTEVLLPQSLVVSGTFITVWIKRALFISRGFIIHKSLFSLTYPLPVDKINTCPFVILSYPKEQKLLVEKSLY